MEKDFKDRFDYVDLPPPYMYVDIRRKIPISENARSLLPGPDVDRLQPHAGSEYSSEWPGDNWSEGSEVKKKRLSSENFGGKERYPVQIFFKALALCLEREIGQTGATETWRRECCHLRTGVQKFRKLWKCYSYSVDFYIESITTHQEPWLRSSMWNALERTERRIDQVRFPVISQEHRRKSDKGWFVSPSALD